MYYHCITLSNNFDLKLKTNREDILAKGQPNAKSILAKGQSDAKDPKRTNGEPVREQSIHEMSEEAQNQAVSVCNSQAFTAFIPLL
jgi:hypothetical protein